CRCSYYTQVSNLQSMLAPFVVSPHFDSRLCFSVLLPISLFSSRSLHTPIIFLVVLFYLFFVPFWAVVYSVINIKLGEHIVALCQFKIGRAVQQECRDRSRMPSSA